MGDTLGYYDGTKLLSMKDIDGNTPEIFICSTNRSAGKTTWFNRYMVKRFINHGEKFCLMVRYGYEVNDMHNKFFNEIRELFFPQYTMTSKQKANGTYCELYLKRNNDKTGRVCGYVIAINNADNVKKVSHLLADSRRIVFDEFQSEQNKYAPNEVDKFISIHFSLARGGGEQVRYLPVYMISNNVSLLNPYYTALKISARLTDKTNFLRGTGWVLEQGFNESASQANKQSAFNRAFGNNEYVQYGSEKIYLNDSTTFIEKMSGKARYLFTLQYDGQKYGVRLYDSKGIVYINNSPDTSCGQIYAVTIDDMTTETQFMDKSNIYVQTLRQYFNYGALRFSSLEAKEALFTLISY